MVAGPSRNDHAVLEHGRPVGRQQGQQDVGGGLPRLRAAGQHHRVAVPPAGLGQGAAGGPQLGPGRRRVQPERLQRGPPIPEAGHVGLRVDGEGAPLGTAGQHQRRQEVVLVLPGDPALVQLLQWRQEPGGGELGHPDRVEDGQVGTEALGDRVGQGLVELMQLHRGHAEPRVGRRGPSDQPLPGPLRDDHPQLRAAPVPVHPVRVHERPPPAVADDHPLGGQLRQRPGHRRPADPVPFAQLVLGGEPPIQPVAAFQDLLEQQRLELEVDRYGQLRIDGHGTPRQDCIASGSLAERPSRCSTSSRVAYPGRAAGPAVRTAPPGRPAGRPARSCRHRPGRR